MSDFKIFEYEINTAKLPAGSTGPVFVMLADLHNFSYGEGNERLAEAIPFAGVLLKKKEDLAVFQEKR